MDIATLVEGGISRAPLSRIAPASQPSPATKRTSNGPEADAPIRKYRKRDPASLTKSACLACKRAKAKLPCARCTQRVDRNKPETCIYEPRLRGGKSDLLRQFADLQTKYDFAKQIFQGLLLEERTPELLQRLRNGDTYELIVNWLNTFPQEKPPPPSGLLHEQLLSYHEDSNRGNTAHESHRALATRPILETPVAPSLGLDSKTSDLPNKSSHASEKQKRPSGSFSPQSQGFESDQSSVVETESSGDVSAKKDQVIQNLIQENMRLSAQVRELQALLKPTPFSKTSSLTPADSDHVGDEN